MSVKIQFDTGEVIEFDSQPSQADIDEAYSSVRGGMSSTEREPEKNFGILETMSLTGEARSKAIQRGLKDIISIPDADDNEMMDAPGISHMTKGEYKRYKEDAALRASEMTARAAREQNPIAGAVGDIGASMGYALPAAAVAGMAAPGAVSSMIASGLVGGSILGPGQRQYRLKELGNLRKQYPEKFADLTDEEIEKAAMTSGALTGGSVFLPGGIGTQGAKGLITGIASGIGMNLGLDIADAHLQNKILEDYPGLQMDPYDPLRLSFSALFGTVAGATGRIGVVDFKRAMNEFDGTAAGYRTVTKKKIKEMIPGRLEEVVEVRSNLDARETELITESLSRELSPDEKLELEAVQAAKEVASKQSKILEALISDNDVKAKLIDEEEQSVSYNERFKEEAEMQEALQTVKKAPRTEPESEEAYWRAQEQEAMSRGDSKGQKLPEDLPLPVKEEKPEVPDIYRQMDEEAEKNFTKDIPPFDETKSDFFMTPEEKARLIETEGKTEANKIIKIFDKLLEEERATHNRGTSITQDMPGYSGKLSKTREAAFQWNYGKLRLMEAELENLRNSIKNNNREAVEYRITNRIVQLEDNIARVKANWEKGKKYFSTEEIAKLEQEVHEALGSRIVPKIESVEYKGPSKEQSTFTKKSNPINIDAKNNLKIAEKDFIEGKLSLEEFTFQYIQHHKYFRTGVRFTDPKSFFNTPNIRTNIESMLKILGLDKTSIVISDLSDLTPQARTMFLKGQKTMESYGRMHSVNKDQAFIFINPRIWHEYKTNPRITAFYDDIRKAKGKEVASEFRASIVIAHEIGHFYLEKLLWHGVFEKPELNSLISQYKNWYRSLNDNEFRSEVGILPEHFSRAIDPEFDNYYNKFPEFFANEIVKKVLYSKSEMKPTSVPKYIYDGIQNIKNMWASFLNTFTKHFKGYNVKPIDFMDTFFNNFIEKNANIVKNTAKENIFDAYHKTQTSDWNTWRQELNRNLYGINVAGKGSILNDMPYPIKNKTDVMSIAQELVDNDISDIYLPSRAIIGNLFGKQQLKRIFETNPIIRYVVDSINIAEHTATEIHNRLWKGTVTANSWNAANKGPFVTLSRMSTANSPEQMITRASNADINTVMDVIISGYGKPYKDTLAANGVTMSPFQRDLFRSLTMLWKHQFMETNKILTRLGKSPLRYKEGWYPSVRMGDWFVELRIMDTPIYRQHFRHKEQAGEFIYTYSQNAQPGIDISPIQKVETRKADDVSDFTFNVAEQIAKEMEHTYGALARTKIDSVLEKIIKKSGQVGKHHQHRHNMQGYLGSELFNNPVQRAEAWRKAIHSSAGEYPGILKKIMISNSVDPILKVQSVLHQTHPHSMELANMIYESGMNTVPKWSEGLDNSIRKFSDEVAISSAEILGLKEKYPEIYTIDRINGHLSHLFYLWKLVSRPGFWLGQLLTSPTAAMRHLFRDGNILDGLAAVGKSFHTLINPDPEFIKSVHWLSQNTEVFQPQFINDVTRLNLLEKNKILQWLTGEIPAKSADSFSRYWTYAMMYEYYKRQGYSGDDLWQQATDATNYTMITYGRSDKPLVFQKMGVLGDAVAPLQTYAQGQLGNLFADLYLIKDRKDLKSLLPLAMTGISTILMAGSMGLPLLAEYEALRLIVKKITGWEAPSLYDFMLRNFDDSINFGPISSATGVDIGSTMRFNPILSGIMLGQKSFLEYLPAISFSTSIPTNLLTFANWEMFGGEVTDAQARRAGLELIPGGYGSLLDEGAFNAGSRAFVPGGIKGHAQVPQTNAERISVAMGLPSVEQTKQRRISNIIDQEEKDLTAKRSLNTSILYDGILKGDSDKIEKSLNYLINSGLSSDNIRERINEEMKNRNIPELQRRIIGKNLNARLSRERKRKVTEYPEYLNEALDY